MSTTMRRVRRAGLGLVVAAFSVGMVATSTTGTALGATSHGHVVVCHRWGN